MQRGQSRPQRPRFGRRPQPGFSGQVVEQFPVADGDFHQGPGGRLLCRAYPVSYPRQPPDDLRRHRVLLLQLGLIGQVNIAGRQIRRCSRNRRRNGSQLYCRRRSCRLR